MNYDTSIQKIQYNITTYIPHRGGHWNTLLVRSNEAGDLDLYQSNLEDIQIQ